MSQWMASVACCVGCSKVHQMIRQWRNCSTLEAWRDVPIWKSKGWKKQNPTTLKYTQESSGSVMHVVTTDPALNICQSHLATMSGEVILSCDVRLWDTSLQIHAKAAAYAGIWSNFRCARESSAYALGDIVRAPGQHICESHLALGHSRWYSVLWLEYETHIAY